MPNGTVKEYDLPMVSITGNSIEDFINWYNGKENGTITTSFYKMKKSFNLGPFLNRYDYIIFSKIDSFEVMDYYK